MKWLAKKVNWLWRLFMTGILFLSFSLGGWVLSHFFIYAVNLVEKNEVRRIQKMRQWTSRSFRLFLYFAQKTGVLTLHIEGQELLRKDKGRLIIANHPTLLDYVIIAAVMEEIDCVVKANLLQNFFIGKLIRQLNYLPNDDDAEYFLGEIQSRLNANHNVLIFPEGTRSTVEKPLVLQRGASRIALKTQCQLRIIKINCSESILSKGASWYEVPSEKPVFTLQVGDIVDSQQFMLQVDEESIAARRLTKHLTQLLQPFKQ